MTTGGLELTGQRGPKMLSGYFQIGTSNIVRLDPRWNFHSFPLQLIFAFFSLFGSIISNVVQKRSTV